MRIGFDLSPLERPFPPGVVRAVRGAWRTLDARTDVEAVPLRPPEGAGLRRWRQIQLVREEARLGLDGIHSFVSAFPWRGRGRRVHTVHELPWRHGVSENADWRHRFWASLGTRRADRVICPSAYVARDLRGISGVTVLPWGLDPGFGPEPPAGEIDEVVLDTYRLGEEPFVLVLGTVRPKKNLPALLEGLALHNADAERPLRLVLTGDETPELRRILARASRLGLARWVSTLGRVAEEELHALLRLSTAVAVLSHSEGFAFPALEGLASGTPVLASRDSAQAELTGDHGILVEPEVPATVADGLARSLRERERARMLLPERAAEFTWERWGTGLVTLWRELVE